MPYLLKIRQCFRLSVGSHFDAYVEAVISIWSAPKKKRGTTLLLCCNCDAKRLALPSRQLPRLQSRKKINKAKDNSEVHDRSNRKGVLDKLRHPGQNSSAELCCNLQQKKPGMRTSPETKQQQSLQRGQSHLAPGVYNSLVDMFEITAVQLVT